MGEMLKEEHKKNYKVVSRILGILMRIANVCCWIGVGLVQYDCCICVNYCTKH